MTGRRLRFSANISMLFDELSFPDRIDAARAAGFDAVECHFPYAFDRSDLKARLAANGLTLNGLNTAPGRTGEFGLAALPGREEEFGAAMAQAIEWAVDLNVAAIHVMAGSPPPQDRAWALETYLQNLERACDMARGSDVTLLIEPINTFDRPGYFLTRSDEAAEILAELRTPRLKMMFDVYHVQIMEGDLLRRLERHWPVIGHIQIASVPHRREPDEGEVAYAAIFDALTERGWAGWVGAEYRPRGRTQDGLGWLDAARR